VDRLDRPILLAFQRALELVDARRSSVPLNLPDGQQITLADFPDLAVREALANALIHRDHRLPGPVVVEHSRTTLVVTSPGPLVAGVTPANILTHVSKPRNPTLAAAFRTLGLAEETGRGVDRMYREMIRSGRDLPHIDDRGDNVRVSFVGGAPNTRVARYVTRIGPDEQNDTDTLLVLFVLCARPSVTAAAMAPILQKGEDETEGVLRRLSADPPGMTEPTRSTARRSRPTYRLRGSVLSQLGPAITYRRRAPDEIDRKVVDHMREYGKVTNRTVRNMFDVDVQRAKTILGDLVERGVIVKTSTRQRGPNIEYGPGPAFPGDRSRPGGAS
jgi:ATP-dependent DNA helicase RecG